VEKLEAILFRETATFGIRRQTLERSVRVRQAHSVETVWGVVEGKLGWHGAADEVFTPEFESCAAAAREHGVPLREVYRAALAAFRPTAQSVRPLPQAAIPRHHDHD